MGETIINDLSKLFFIGGVVYPIPTWVVCDIHEVAKMDGVCREHPIALDDLGVPGYPPFHPLHPVSG